MKLCYLGLPVNHIGLAVVQHFSDNEVDSTQKSHVESFQTFLTPDHILSNESTQCSHLIRKLSSGPTGSAIVNYDHLAGVHRHRFNLRKQVIANVLDISIVLHRLE